ncbi:MAG: hypothetical protein WC483_05660 [Candidatus Paceibacterota bacterium]
MVRPGVALTPARRSRTTCPDPLPLCGRGRGVWRGCRDAHQRRDPRKEKTPERELRETRDGG